MGTPAPDAVERLVDRFDQDRRVFLSGDYNEEQLSKAKMPHEQESVQRRHRRHRQVYLYRLKT